MQRAASIEPEQNEQKVIELPPAEAESILVQRVEPQYPEHARQQQVQGAQLCWRSTSRPTERSKRLIW